jgi:hypothetical protein
MVKSKKSKLTSMGPVIENGAIVIRIDIASLPDVIAGAVSIGAIDPPLRITDARAFAKDLIAALDDEDHDGTTIVARMLDEAVEAAFSEGANGIEEMDEDE